MPLPIFDEPTAHLDPPARRALTADLLHATQDRSVLFITHQPDGLDQVDHIVVLDHGRIAEQGTHRQLRHAGGHYQRMRDGEHRPLPPCPLPGATVTGGHRVYGRFRHIAHGGVCRRLPR
jgi:ABC-type multidrug transport system ATPase subunit